MNMQGVAVHRENIQTDEYGVIDKQIQFSKEIPSGTYILLLDGSDIRIRKKISKR